MNYKKIAILATKLCKAINKMEKDFYDTHCRFCFVMLHNDDGMLDGLLIYDTNQGDICFGENVGVEYSIMYFWKCEDDWTLNLRNTRKFDFLYNNAISRCVTELLDELQGEIATEDE